MKGPFRMAREVRGMIVIITGASAGIGRALARELSDRGATLVLAARRRQRLERFNHQLSGRHLCVETDVSEPQHCRRLIDAAIAKFGRIDTLVCDAGFGLIRRVCELGGNELTRLLATNVLGTTECIHHAVPQMRVQPLEGGWRGQVVIVSSAAARRGLPEFGGYTATKAAQLSLAEALRVELRPDRIAVTSVHPCGTDTEFFRAAIRHSGRLPPQRNSIEVHQSAAQVAVAIADAIAKPRPEVWPLRRFRLLMSLATCFPGVTDRIVARRLRAAAERETGKPVAAVTASS